MDLISSTMEPFEIGKTDTSPLLWVLIVGFVVAFFLAFGVGANDVANSFGTSVGAKVLTLRQACILATIFETLGAVLIGYKVSDTVRKGIFDVNIYQGEEKSLMLGCLSALLASAVWNILATFLALPISGTHSIVGAMAGFTIVAKGFSSIKWMGLLKIVLSWFVSPVLSGLLSAAVFLVILKFIIQAQNPIRNALLFLPFFYLCTLFVNFVSIFMDGPEVLKFDLIPFWAAALISASLAITCAFLVWCLFVPRFKTAMDIKNTNKRVFHIVNGNNNSTPEAKECHVNVGFENTEVSNSTSKTSSVHDVNMNSVDNQREINELFSALQVLTAIFGSFAHGGNDVSNAIGPLVSLWLIYSEGTVAQKSETPLYILLFGGLGMCVGLWVYGKKVIQTVGENLTKISASNGFSIEVGAATTVLTASKIGLPISTTHCKVGSIVFVGFVHKDAGGVNWNLFRGIVAAWVFTLPITGGISAAIMSIIQAVV
ncbi:sodium-dependent phosphate transporter 1-B-like [Tropilaelaps mercedesae]|uniref:Phosphate transporter n=1 Tax=Tropilaelaps mercedesae TaxID=418985 RepID=A0A1V9XYM5_9ACAR|nr:sodium-dependent phosphate transporter 1-B-like [Tropilaelaps mercedesae]